MKKQNKNKNNNNNRWSKQDSQFRLRSHMPKHEYDNDQNYCMLFCEFYKICFKSCKWKKDRQCGVKKGQKDKQ